jgi:hypothetical protein
MWYRSGPSERFGNIATSEQDFTYLSSYLNPTIVSFSVKDCYAVFAKHEEDDSYSSETTERISVKFGIGGVH